MTGRVVWLWLAVLLVGCPSSPAVDDDDDDSSTVEPRFGPEEIGGEERPAPVTVPSSYDGVTLMPAIIGLHGRGVNATIFDQYLNISDRVESREFVLVLPEGLDDPNGGGQFWNAHFRYEEPDDIGYLLGLMDELVELFAVDPDRIYLAGHSNGSYMAYRMICEHPERIAGILGFAGGTYRDEGRCEIGPGTSVLHLHGPEDDRNPYDGSEDYLPIEESTALWATAAGCGGPTPDPPRDLDSVQDGDETQVTRWQDCPEGRGVELWRVEGAGHVPVFTDQFKDGWIDWMLARTRVD